MDALKPSANSPSKLKVLLVEDEFILFDQIQDILELKGFEVLKKEPDAAVGNFDDAVFLLHKHQLDLAILDINVPGKKDGIELGAYIRGSSGIPIIFLSGHPTVDNLTRIRSITDADFVVKENERLSEQLWTTIQLQLLQHKNNLRNIVEGSLMKVYEFTTSISISDQEEPLSLEIFITWNEIITIDSYNSGQAFSKNNNIIFNLMNGKKYRARKTLTEIEGIVPAYLVRCNQSTIINANLVEARSHSVENSICIIEGQKISIGSSYRQKVIDQINLCRNKR